MAHGVRGVARDLSAAGLGPLKTIDTTPVPGQFTSPVGVTLDFPEDQTAAPVKGHMTSSCRWCC